MNISEIAKMAGVSRAAVSRYFNDGYVSEEKKERIREIIEKTGYRPSASAQALRTKKSRLIGVIAPKISSESVSKIVNGLSEGLKEQGYHMVLGNTENDASQELEFMKVFANNNVDGMILIATMITPEHTKMMDSLNIPIVLIGQKMNGYYCVYHDDYHAARDLARIFLKSGVKVPAYLGVTEEDAAVGAERKRGFLDAAGELKAEIPPDRMQRVGFSYESGYEGMKALKSRHPDVDGVFCVTDTIAAGAMEYLKEQGVKIPQEFAVAGMGDSHLSRVVTPKLTTVHYFYEESGKEAAGILLYLLEGKVTQRKEIILGYELIERDSM